MGMTPEDFPTGAGNFEAVCPETFVNGNLGQSVGRWRTGFVFGGFCPVITANQPSGDSDSPLHWLHPIRTLRCYLRETSRILSHGSYQLVAPLLTGWLIARVFLTEPIATRPTTRHLSDPISHDRYSSEGSAPGHCTISGSDRGTVPPASLKILRVALDTRRYLLVRGNQFEFLVQYVSGSGVLPGLLGVSQNSRRGKSHLVYEHFRIVPYSTLPHCFSRAGE